MDSLAWVTDSDVAVIMLRQESLVLSIGSYEFWETIGQLILGGALVAGIYALIIAFLMFVDYVDVEKKSSQKAASKKVAKSQHHSKITSSQNVKSKAQKAGSQTTKEKRHKQLKAQEEVLAQLKREGRRPQSVEDKRDEQAKAQAEYLAELQRRAQE